MNILLAILLVCFPLAACGDCTEKDSPVVDNGELVITVVYDNNPFDERLKTDWGFGAVIQGLEKTVLFDTGTRGEILMANMETLGFDPAAIDVVVLSHEHGDHVGGLDTFLAANADVDVYMPPSFSQGIKEKVKKAGARVIELKPGMEICKGMFSTGEMGTRIKEAGAYIKIRDGILVVTGCAHPGIAEITAKAKELSEATPYLVMGGFHLGGHSNEAVQGIIDSFREMGVVTVMPTHCTGDNARAIFKEAFGENYNPGGVGTVLRVPIN